MKKIQAQDRKAQAGNTTNGQRDLSSEELKSIKKIDALADVWSRELPARTEGEWAPTHKATTEHGRATANFKSGSSWLMLGPTSLASRRSKPVDLDALPTLFLSSHWFCGTTDKL
jgi:hypothetical protein